MKQPYGHNITSNQTHECTTTPPRIFRPLFQTKDSPSLGRRSSVVMRGGVATCSGVAKKRGSTASCSSVVILSAIKTLGRTPLVLVGLFVAMIICLSSNTTNVYASTLTLNIDQSPVLNIMPKSDTGDFAKSSNSTISVSTDYTSGYTLGIAASSSQDLIGSSSSSHVIETIGSATAEADFKASANASTYNNKWGYLPSKYNSSDNTSFLPSPTTSGDTLMVTECANGTANTACANTTDTYTLAIGARASLDTPIDSYSNTFVISAVANVTFLAINYQANNSYYNGGYFGSSSSNTVNTVEYDARSSEVPLTNPQYSHTANINDAGEDNNTQYASNLNTNEVISFPGADHLGISLTYQTEACCDFLIVWAGNCPNYLPNNSTQASLGTKYANATKTTTNITINDSAVTFGFKSDGSVQYYGYYAVVTGYDASNNVLTHGTAYSKTAEAGTYTAPTLPSGMNFVGWATTNNATVAEYTSESDISTKLAKVNGDQDVTLYPVTTSNVTIKTVTGVSTVTLKDGSTTVCTASSTSGTTCALATGKDYTLSYSISTGYTFGSWTKTGVGTLSSTTGNNVTFTVGAGATTITPSATLNSYNITVNFVGGISSVTFTNSTYGNAIVSSSGGTVSLKYNQRYDISVTLNNGNYFLSWEKVSGSGTLGSTFTMNTYFTPSSGVATLRITAANTQIKTADGIDSVTVSTTGGSQVCTTTDATTGVYCNLTLGTAYNITATTHQGYTFSSWSNTGSGTIGSSTSSTTTFTPVQSSAIDVITPSATGNPYTLTVVFGNANVLSVTVNGTTFNTSGGTITLTAGTAYTISGTTDLNAVAFSASANGKVSGNTVTVYGDTTLTATGLSKIYMQNMDASLCTTTPIEVYDSRGGEQAYTVARLNDGKCWMLESLNLPGGTALSADDTDVTSTYIDGFTTQGNLTKSGNTIVLPASATKKSGNTSLTDSTQFSNNSNAYVFNSGNNTTTCNGATPCNSYYSWIAATLGGKQANGSTNQTSNGYNAAASICPKGWRLPTSTTSNANATTSPNWKTGDWYALATAYGANLESNYYQNAATFYNNAGPGTTLNFLLAGYYRYGSFADGGSYGNYWSATSRDSSRAYTLTFSSGSVYSANNFNRYSGTSVRCLLSE